MNEEMQARQKQLECKKHGIVWNDHFNKCSIKFRASPTWRHDGTSAKSFHDLHTFRAGINGNLIKHMQI